MRRRLLLALLLLLAVGTGPACSSDQIGSDTGASMCEAAWTPVVYDPAAAAGSIAFMDECDESKPEQCASGVCKYFNHASKAYCTTACEVAEDCACPSGACNMKGLCKAPGGQ